jgi:hypothetical protein
VLEINRPPTMRMLLQDETFREMMRRRPRIPGNLTRPELSPPWQVWVLTGAEKWRRGEFPTYSDAFAVMRAKLKDESILDVSLVSKRFLMGPPPGFKWQSRKYPWCPRCRRPSLFLTKYSHRNLRDVEVTFDEPIRCFYCGIRQAAFPRYVPIAKPKLITSGA